MMMAGGGGSSASAGSGAGGGEEDGAAYTINGAAKNRSDDSHSRLFGPVNGAQPTPNKNRMKSNIVLGQESEQAPATNGTNGSPIGDCDESKINVEVIENTEKLQSCGETGDYMIKPKVSVMGEESVNVVETNLTKAREAGKCAIEETCSEAEEGDFDKKTKDDEESSSLCTSSGRPISRTNNIVVHNDILKPQKRASCRRPDGNPVTGNGYPESTSGSVTSNSSNGSSGNGGRSRVPPGGFSSGLW